jgi:Saxitoxin biosynthesis operon protein SxtJ
VRQLTRRDSRELRHFGLGLALLLALIFWALLPWLGDRPRPAWPLVAGAVLAALALIWPAAILPIYRGFLPVARVLGVVNTWLLLGVVFFGILTPLGWMLRRLGRLQYETRFEPGAASYRVEVPRDHAVRLEEPF